jgi:hypothetical protein
MAATGAIWRRHLTDGGIQWLRASSEALDVLHQVMCPTLYCCIAMAIEIASNLPVYFILVNLLLTTSTIELYNIVL